MLSLARILTRTGYHAEALAIHREIAVQVNRLPLYLVPFADALISAGELPEAVTIAREVVDAEPGVGHRHNWYATMLWRQGDRAAAVAHLARAVTLNPSDRRYRRKLLRYRVVRYTWAMRSVLSFSWQRRWSR